VSLDLYHQFRLVPDDLSLRHLAGAITAILLNLLLNRGAAEDERPGTTPRARRCPTRSTRYAPPIRPLPGHAAAAGRRPPGAAHHHRHQPVDRRETCAWIREQGDERVDAVCQKWMR
jgi:NCS2 family nucleobase:cation symporter-2